MAQWVKLKDGWIDLDHAPFILDIQNGSVALYDGIAASGTGLRYLGGEDAEAVRRHLNNVAVNPGAGLPRKAPTQD